MNVDVGFAMLFLVRQAMTDNLHLIILRGFNFPLSPCSSNH